MEGEALEEILLWFARGVRDITEGEGRGGWMTALLRDCYIGSTVFIVGVEGNTEFSLV